ncbi:MAG: hypothetical protein V4679_17565 [Pseudomonadota bacterium]
MAIPIEQQKHLIKLVIGMFGIAPGYTYLPMVIQGFEGTGGDPGKTATELGKLAPFKALYPPGMTGTEFSAAFGTNFLAPLGLTPEQHPGV